MNGQPAEGGGPSGAGHSDYHEAEVIGVAIDSSGQRVILLKPCDAEPGTGKLLPIWIGEQEATAILVAIEGVRMPRPLAHDLVVAVADVLGGRVTRAAISSLAGGTFYGEVWLEGPDGEHVVDARPSDAIAVASRAGAPVLVSEDVLEAAGIEDTVTGPARDDLEDADEDGSPSAASAPESEEDAARRVSEFRDFLDTVDPEDFRE